jgi:hypothetical protein
MRLDREETQRPAEVVAGPLSADTRRAPRRADKRAVIPQAILAVTAPPVIIADLSHFLYYET